MYAYSHCTNRETTHLKSRPQMLSNAVRSIRLWQPQLLPFQFILTSLPSHLLRQYITIHKTSSLHLNSPPIVFVDLNVMPPSPIAVGDKYESCLSKCRVVILLIVSANVFWKLYAPGCIHCTWWPPRTPTKIMFHEFPSGSIRYICNVWYEGLCNGIVAALGADNILKSMSDEPTRRYSSPASQV